MKTKFPHVACLLIGSLCATPSYAVDRTWVGGTGNWGTSGNWNPDPPTFGNNVDLFFTTPAANLNNNFLSQNRVARSLNYTGTLGTTVNTAIGNQYSGGVTARNLTFEADSGNASINIQSGVSANINLGAGDTTQGNIALADNLDIDHNGTGFLSILRPITGAFAITKTGAGTVVFGGTTNSTNTTINNTYSGLTTVSAGALVLNKTNATGGGGFNAIHGNVLITNAGVVSNNVSDQIRDAASIEVAGGSYVLAGNNETVTGVKLTGGSITSTTGVLTSSNAYDFQHGSVSAILAGSNGLNKTTPGTVTLSGTNTYTGNTAVTGGVLLINGKTAAGSAVSVSSASIIGGSGTIEGNLTLSGGALFAFDPLSTLTVGGTLSLDPTFGVASLRNSLGGTLNWSTVANNTYTLLNTSFTFNDSNISNFGFANAFSLGGGRSAYFQNGGLQLVVVPEPSTVIAAAGLLTAFVLLGRRRGKAAGPGARPAP